MVKETLKRIKRAIQWAKIGYKDKDFDYLYLFDIISKKLDMMEKYYSTSNITEEDPIIASQIKKANNLMKCIMRIDTLDFSIKYVNTKNASRFVTQEMLGYESRNIFFKEYLFRKKALKLFCDILSSKVFSWWN